MRTVKEVSRLTGVSIRTLHYYDYIGLLKPSKMTEAGYRLYDDTALERLQMILLFRELNFSLKEIKNIIDCPDFDRKEVLDRQIRFLELQREHIDDLITLARGIQITGVNYMDFSAFDTRKIDEYAAQAKAMWGKTEAYKEFEQKTAKLTDTEKNESSVRLMKLFEKIGGFRDLSPASEDAQMLVEELKNFITENFYNCTPQILSGLGKMYAGGGSMTENIDIAGGKGTAEFISKAIEIYCGK